MLPATDLARLLVPLAIGLLIGIERGWQHRAAQPGSRVAGLRTFALFGLIGGLAGFAAGGSEMAGWVISAVLVLAAAALIVIGYRRDANASATTEAAALVTLALGWLAGHGWPVPALALGAITAFLLAQRQALHGWLKGLSEADLQALVRFAVIAGALWPVLPDAQMGPYGSWNPRTLWLVVVVVCTISFAGYVAGRRLGAGQGRWGWGVLVTAAVGAIYSSTAVTAALAQRLKPEPAAQALLTAGIAVASLVMFARVGLLVGLLVPFAFIDFAAIVAPAAGAALLLALLLARRAGTAAAGAPPAGNPFALLPAIGFALLVALVSLVAHWAQAQFGDRGVAITLAITGAMDVDAAIVALRALPPGTVAPELAGSILALPVLLNTLLKLGVVLVQGGTFGWKAGRPLALAAAALLAGFALEAWRMGWIN
jgi:uncharacterized membrane protein (DUF4010 family)